MADLPKLFRVVLQVADLDQAFDFYTKLIGTPGRKLGGSRAYFDCGPVILAVFDPTPGAEKASPNPDYIYFSVSDIEKAHARARDLNCLSKEKIHNKDAGEIVTRPWGERSFYVEDPWGNGLCFVDETTVFTGR
jgi:predicted enzyme related to lactoylglutathione lyase